ncbi:MAG: phospholipase D family protein [Burkholderiales bacterium]|nr:phospholipase D family protein [Burkholderiales bacterium]
MKSKLSALFVVSLIAIGSVFANEDFLTKLHNLFGEKGSPTPTIVKATGTIEVAFSPKNGATSTIIKAINEAQKTILVSAYNFTSKDIAKALLNKKKQGLEIKIILDKSQVTQKYSSATFFANLGFDMRIDIKHAIYHDKVMIIDDKTVITGSFNFTKAAEEKNAENVLIIRNNPELAKLYTEDWFHNWQLAISRDEFMTKKGYKVKVGNENGN